MCLVRMWDAWAWAAERAGSGRAGGMEQRNADLCGSWCRTEAVRFHPHPHGRQGHPSF